MEELLEQLLEECRPYTKQGRVASYIPELAKGNPDDFGISILSSNGRYYHAGDYKKKFTIQSVIKPIILLIYRVHKPYLQFCFSIFTFNDYFIVGLFKKQGTCMYCMSRYTKSAVIYSNFFLSEYPNTFHIRAGNP